MLSACKIAVGGSFSAMIRRDEQGYDLCNLPVTLPLEGGFPKARYRCAMSSDEVNAPNEKGERVDEKVQAMDALDERRRFVDLKSLSPSACSVFASCALG